MPTIGKLTVNLNTHEKLGDIFIIRCVQNDGVFENDENESLTLRLTKETAAKLAEYINNELDEEVSKVPANC